MAGSIKFFKSLPQKFVTNITKNKIKPILNLTLKDILSNNFCEKGENYEIDLKKYYHNKDVLKYLENNNNINQKSNFHIFKNMTISEIFIEYLESKEFENEITNLKQKNENNKYIIEYIIKATNLLDFFTN